MSGRAHVSSEDLDDLIERILIGKPMAFGRHLLGIEYERLILHRQTRASAPVEFCQAMLKSIAEDIGGRPVLEGEVLKGVAGDEFDASLEPGGQLELAIRPLPHLAAIDAVVQRATGAVTRALAGSDYELVALGHAPVTPVDELGLLPRARYRIMNERMPPRGPLTRNMMRATAGFQLTYDVDDAVDAGRKMAMLFRLTPVLMAITANSRAVAGEDSGYASFRHHVWWHTDFMRSGVPAGALHGETAIRGYVEFAKAAHMLFFDRESGLEPAPDRSLAEVVAEGGVTAADVDLHLTSLFPFVRLRNYIEVRCFDAVEWTLARSVLALVSGLVYCSNAFANADALSHELLVEDRRELETLHEHAARAGLDATAPSGRKFRELARLLVEFAGATLGKSTCDWARPDDLGVVEDWIG